MREGWEEMTIGEIADVIGGGTPSTKEDAFWNGKIPWITPYDLSNHTSKYISEGGRTITELGLKKSSAKLHPKNTILLTSRAPIGYLAIAKNEISTNQGFQSLICDEKLVDPNFIYYSLQVFMIKIKAIASGATFPEVSGKKVRRIKLPIPPLETQRKIASILSGYDDLIENNLKRIKILEEMAQQTYEEWFVRMRFPGYETAVMNEETGLPEGWDRKYFKAVLNFRTGKLDSNALKLQGEFDFYTCAKEVFKTDTYCFEGEAVLLGGNNATGDFALFYANSKLDAYQRTYIITPKTDELSNVYVFQVLRIYLPHFKAVSSGASTKFLTMRILDKTKIIVPKTSVLEKFNSFTKPSFDAILNLQSQNQRLREARDILLPRLMMGIVEV
ncbi:restriction endonuclease subunit S [Kaistella carnis]|uniref:restriction endonuclease subunit S n=1 Tax=Kaistella carnis TaxID=1241979 RepID=UPI00289A5F3F|nr:restriction endonuclease subunit S [Kaistella carnis]